MRKETHVHCPYCKNKRLFDIEYGAIGTVKIKCPICKNIVDIKLEKIIQSKSEHINL